MKKAYAMVLENYGEDLVYKEFDLHESKGGEVIVKILACGICGSDVHVWQGEDARSQLPMILGHEGIGFICKVNPGRKDIFENELKEGDFVIWNRGVSCKKCYSCLIKRKTYICKDRWSYGFSKSINDYPYLNGSYSTHIRLTEETDIIRVIPKENIVEEIDYVPYVSACCAGTTTACVFEQVKVESGDTVIIQGPGPLGIYGVLFARECGADKIIVIGGTEDRLDICREAGATLIINRQETTIEERYNIINNYTDERGGDIVIELAGTKDAVEEGIYYVADGGTYATAGIAVDVGEIHINWFKNIVRKNIKIQGVWVGDIKNTWQAIKLYERNKNLLNKMITHRFKLKDATLALKTMRSKAAVKAVIVNDD